MKNAEYFDYDTLNNERTEICQKIMEEFPDLEASIGGQISVDIYPKGRNKGQILASLMVQLFSLEI